MDPIFIQTQIKGDMNVISYSKKKLKCIKNETRTQIWFVPESAALKEKIKREIKRGNTFFTLKDGFLFGALYELTKLGEIIKKTV